MQKRLIIFFLTLFTFIIATGCSIAEFSGTEGDPSKASVGIMYTHDYKDRTIIQWLDDEQNVVATSKYPYSSAMISFENADVVDGRICIAPRGPFGKSDETDVLAIDPTDGSYIKTELSEINHVSCSNEGNLMVVSGNSNGEGYIDLIDLDTGEVRNYTDTRLWDEGIMQVFLLNGEVYGSGGDIDWSGVYKIDVDEKKLERIFDIKDDPQIHAPTYLSRHGDDLVFLDDKKLIKYDTKSGKTDSFELSRDDYSIVNISGDRVWLGYTDQHTSEYDSLVEVREYESGEIIDTEEVECPIWQISLMGDTAYLLLGDYDKARKLILSNGKLESVYDIAFDPELDEYSYGAVFALKE